MHITAEATISQNGLTSQKSVLWMFYAADKGIAPPAIRGYLKEEGHDTSKIMCVLNAFYKQLTEKNGKEPIPMDVFVQRKQIINELSKVRSKTVVSTTN